MTEQINGLLRDRARGERLRVRAVHAVVHQGAGRGGRHHERPARRGRPATATTSRTSRSTSRASRAASGADPTAPREAGAWAAARDCAPWRRVMVVGAGVIGLTCAVRLLEAGHRVDVVARDLPLETTSAVAAALWYPYRALPQDRVDRLGGAVVRRLRRAGATEPASGVGCAPAPRSSAQPPATRGGATPCRPAPGSTGRRPARGVRRRLDVRHAGRRDAGLPRLAGRPGRRARRHPHPAEPVRAAHRRRAVVVNCAGLGARLLGGGPVGRRRCAARSCASSRSGSSAGGSTPTRPTYVVPRAATSCWAAPTIEGEWSRTPEPATAAADPGPGGARSCRACAGAGVLRHKVGLRPAVPSVRLERAGDVVHCYGHGGCGVTVSWGCADEVVGLVDG